jgi:hypothetical protein
VIVVGQLVFVVVELRSSRARCRLEAAQLDDIASVLFTFWLLARSWGRGLDPPVAATLGAANGVTGATFSWLQPAKNRKITAQTPNLIEHLLVDR